ncbi:hypothetical protein V5279_24460 [Bradyrhizobium sp. 26S5]|uniref:hypothetical protein n=1 Tax=Bradyrhizobium sp. 26S5 TaxID=3139729 RepID=UPI0030D303F3
MVIKRRRFKQDQPLQERLCDEGQRLRAMATEMPVGAAKEAALEKARQMETASHVDEWLSSAGSQSPK